jgi:hypothetical protein
MPSALDLPPELWSIICGFSCTDGGATGCALSLASRKFNEVTAAHRYHSVSLLGWGRVRSFLKEIKRLGGMIAVRHLFIALLPATDEGMEPLVHLYRLRAPQERRRKSNTFVVRGRPPTDPLKAAHLIQHVFEGVHRTLQTLSGFCLPSVDPGRMPALRDLIIHYDYKYLSSSELGVIPNQPDLPLLRRAYLLGPGACEQATLFIKRAPELETIRCSRPKGDISALSRRFQSDFPGANPCKRLTRVIFEPAPEYHPCGNGRMSSIQRKVAGTLRAIRETKWLVDTVELQTLPPFQELTSRIQRDEWLNVVGGGRGPWDLHCAPLTFRGHRS